MLRIRMTPLDLARTTLVDQPWAGVELATFVTVLTTRPPGAASALVARLRADLAPEHLAMLSDLHGHGCRPGFVYPAGVDLDEVLERVVTSPPAVMRTDFEEVAAAGYPLARWTYDLARGDRRLLGDLAAALRRIHTEGIRPVLERASNLFVVNALRRQRELASGGIAEVFAHLHPGVSWRPPYLEVELRLAHAHFEVDLHGYGLRLIPSLARTVSVSIDTDQPTLSYPVDLEPPGHPGTPMPFTAGASTVLGALLGSTRAVVLETIGACPGIGTGALAERLEVGKATVSEHTTVLRDNGLITTVRRGTAAAHHLTGLGLQLLAHPIKS